MKLYIYENTELELTAYSKVRDENVAIILEERYRGGNWACTGFYETSKFPMATYMDMWDEDFSDIIVLPLTFSKQTVNIDL